VAGAPHPDHERAGRGARAAARCRPCGSSGPPCARRATPPC
jgi:LmbE family N-acetylglucosaminyl deacetylase